MGLFWNYLKWYNVRALSLLAAFGAAGVYGELFPPVTRVDQVDQAEQAVTMRQSEAANAATSERLV